MQNIQLYSRQPKCPTFLEGIGAAYRLIITVVLRYSCMFHIWIGTGRERLWLGSGSARARLGRSRGVGSASEKSRRRPTAPVCSVESWTQHCSWVGARKNNTNTPLHQYRSAKTDCSWCHVHCTYGDRSHLARIMSRQWDRHFFKSVQPRHLKYEQ